MIEIETIETDLTPLPRRYQAPGVDRAREVAAFYIVREGQPKHMTHDYSTGEAHPIGAARYIQRGAWHEVVPALTPRIGWRGGISEVAREDLRIMLDWSGYRGPELDRPNLCWGGDLLTVDEFLAWIEATR